MLEEVFEVVAPGQPFLQVLFAIEFQRCGYRFVDLPELFAPEAPLEELDHLAEFGGPEKLSRAMALLPAAGTNPRLAAFVREVVNLLPSNISRAGQQLALLLVIAAAATQHAREEYDFTGTQYQELLDLFTCDVAHLPCGPALHDELLKRTDEKTLPLLKKEAEVAREYRGARRLVGLLAALDSPELVGPLVLCMKGDADETAAHEASVALARFGNLAIRHLAGGWEELDFMQRMCAYDVLAWCQGEVAVETLLRLWTLARKDELEVEMWCMTAELLADPRLLQFMQEGQATRRVPAVTQACGTLGALLSGPQAASQSIALGN